MATAQSGDEIVRRVLATRPDVVVMDIRMPGCDGAEATRQILAARPHSQINALKAGALGFLSKTSIADSLVGGIRDAAGGRPVVSSGFLGSLLDALREPPDASPLTQREREILESVARGRTNEQIGRDLGISVSTVKAQLAALFERLGANDRASALAVCFRRGWLT